jgi:hypothetical protein
MSAQRCEFDAIRDVLYGLAIERACELRRDAARGRDYRRTAATAR